MTVHTQRDLEKLSQLARAKYSVSLMSDTKWRKAFEILEDGDFGIISQEYKWIDTEVVLEMGRIGDGFGLWAPHAYFEPSHFPVELRSIEKVTFRFAECEGTPSEKLAAQALQAVGHFPIELDTCSLAIVGYR